MPNRSPSPRSTSTAPDAGKVLKRVNALVPVLRARAAETEKLRRMHPDTVRDLTDADVLRLSVPADVGAGTKPTMRWSSKCSPRSRAAARRRGGSAASPQFRTRCPR